MTTATEQALWDSTPEGRYRRDNHFRQLVDMMEAHMHNASFTPTEMRDASLLAAIHFEGRKVKYLHGYTMTDETYIDAWSRVRQLEEIISKCEPGLQTLSRGI